MFEFKDFEYLLDETLGEVDDRYDKREGSILYTLTAPVCAELYVLYANLDMMLAQTYARTADLDYLIERCKDRGIVPEVGTPAKIRITVSPASITLPAGAMFRMGDVYYRVTDIVASGVYLMTCCDEDYQDRRGTVGNRYSGDILPVQDIPGLERVVFTALEVPGTDDETKDHLLVRYLETFTADDRQGNIDWHKKKLQGFNDVYAVRVSALTYNRWNSSTSSYDKVVDGKTIVAYVIGKTVTGEPMQVGENATQEDVDAVIAGLTEALDPDQESYGYGTGELPFGQTIRVYESAGYKVAVAVTVTLDAGYTLAEVQDEIKAVVKDCFKSIVLDKWKDERLISIRQMVNASGDAVVNSINAVEGVATTDLLFTLIGGDGSEGIHPVTTLEDITVTTA